MSGRRGWLLAALLGLGAGLAGAQPRERLPGERMLVDEIGAMDQQLKELDAREAELVAQSEAMQERKRQHEAERGKAEVELAERRAEAGARLQTLYQMRRRGLATVLLAAQSPADFRRRFQYLSAIIAADRGRIARYEEGLVGLRQADDQVAADLAALRQAQADLGTARSETEAQRQQRVRLLNEIRSSAKLSSAWGRQVEQVRSTYQEPARPAGQETARPDPERQPLAPIQAAPGAGATEAFRAQRGKLPSPIRAQVIRGFGTYTDEAGEARQNLGLDFVSGASAPITAVADGTVTRAGYVRAYGFTVVIAHGGYTTVYSHLSSTRVAVGQQVRAGETLGASGNSGLIDDQRAYLHFEVRYNNGPQDPAEWLPPGAIQCHPEAVNCP